MKVAVSSNADNLDSQLAPEYRDGVVFLLYCAFNI